MLKFAEACGIPAARVTRKDDLRAAIQKMLDTPGPYLLDVIVPHQEHVLPMIPSGGAFKDVITEGDGRRKYSSCGTSLCKTKGVSEGDWISLDSPELLGSVNLVVL
uniref:Thiamine pyrophosphate enzyme TPP-binding domain-containing protein n=1 Tax=Salix viminalis TaxID=40686 RepID=A0A6N2MF46_SALVM